MHTACSQERRFIGTGKISETVSVNTVRLPIKTKNNMQHADRLQAILYLLRRVRTPVGRRDGLMVINALVSTLRGPRTQHNDRVRPWARHLSCHKSNSASHHPVYKRALGIAFHPGVNRSIPSWFVLSKPATWPDR